MLFGFGLDFLEIKKLWAEAASTATTLDANLVREGETKSSFQKFFGKGVKSPIPIGLKKKLGGMCIVSNREKMMSKLADHKIMAFHQLLNVQAELDKKIK